MSCWSDILVVSSVGHSSVHTEFVALHLVELVPGVRILTRTDDGGSHVQILVKVLPANLACTHSQPRVQHQPGKLQRTRPSSRWQINCVDNKQTKHIKWTVSSSRCCRWKMKPHVFVWHFVFSARLRWDPNLTQRKRNDAAKKAARKDEAGSYTQGCKKIWGRNGIIYQWGIGNLGSSVADAKICHGRWGETSRSDKRAIWWRNADVGFMFRICTQTQNKIKWGKQSDSQYLKNSTIQYEQGEDGFLSWIQLTNEKLKLKTIKDKHRAQHLSGQISESSAHCTEKVVMFHLPVYLGLLRHKHTYFKKAM